MPDLPDILMPLIFRFNMKRWSDSAILIIPPNTSFTLIETTPKGKGIINYYIKFGKPRTYDPSTGTIGDVIISDDVGFYRSSGQVKWHNVPFIESVYEDGYGDLTITGENQTECTAYIYNNSSNYVMIDYTSYLLEFDAKYIDEVKKYFAGIADFFLKQVEGGEIYAYLRGLGPK